MAINKDTGLTDKQEKFCQEYLIDLNGTQAAIRAGYSKNSANEQAAQNLAKLSIINRLNELRKGLSEKVGITQKMVLDELAKIGFSNIKDYMDGHLSMKNLNEVEEDKAAAIGSIKKTVSTFEGGETVYTEFKLHDKIKSLELIGKHLGFFEKDNNAKVVVYNTEVSKEEAAEIAKALNEKY